MESNKSQPDSAVSPTMSAGEAPMSFEAWWNTRIPMYAYPIAARGASYHAWNAREPEIAQAKEELIEAESVNKTLEDKLYSSAMEVTALKQELAQAKEEFDQMRDERWMLEDKLYNSAMDLASEISARAALEGKLGEMLKTHVPRSELEAESAAVNQVANERDAVKWKLVEVNEVLHRCRNWIRYNGHTGQHFASSCHECELQAKLGAALEPIKKEEKKRSLAIIAERPGPTADAYDLVCKANNKKYDELQVLEGKLGEMRKYFKDIEHTCGSIDRGAFNQIQEAVDGCSTIAQDALAALEPIKKEEEDL